MRVSVSPAKTIVAAVACAFALGAGPTAAANTDDQTESATTGPELETIVVSARKREESLAEVPTSITAFTAEALSDYNIKSFNDYATKTPNLSFSYGGGPTGIADARAIAIRGITGQNLFGTAGATGFYIDDTPIPGSVDPRILDIDNIEVLKGPQGTLYGESSLGGNVRLVTKQPNLSKDELTYTLDIGETSGTGAPNGGVSAVANLLQVPGAWATRVVVFVDHEAGYLTRTYPDPSSPATTDPFLQVPRTSDGNQGANTTWGGSVTSLIRPIDSFDIKLRVMHQESFDHGFPATFAPLPAFEPDYTLDRAFNVQPKATDYWWLPSLDLQFRGSGWTLVSSNSYFYRHTKDLEDSTYGTEQILGPAYYQVSGLPPQPFLWDGEHQHHQFTSETRLSFEPIHNISGTVGFYYANTRSLFYIPPTYAQGLTTATIAYPGVSSWPNDEIWEQQNPGQQKDTSVFGEVYYKFLQNFSLTLGAREYWLKQSTDFTADGFMNFGPTPSAPTSNSQNGLNPKIGLSWQMTPEAMAYASASKGFRAGGAQPFLTFCQSPTLSIDAITHLRSDTLWTYEGGFKVQFTDPAILLTAAGFHIDWKNLQQQIALSCGAYEEVNGDSARIDGGEFEAIGHVTPELQVRVGAGYESTSISDPGALGPLGIHAGSRILGVPAWTATAGGIYKRPLFAVTGFVGADYSYTGNSISLLNGGSGLIATRPAYSLVDTRIGMDWNQSELSLNVRNLTNAKPNLGDIGYVGYAQYTAAQMIIPQVATMPPATVSLEFKQTF